MQFALTRLSLPAQRHKDELAAYTHVPTSGGVRHHNVRRASTTWSWIRPPVLRLEFILLWYFVVQELFCIGHGAGVPGPEVGRHQTVRYWRTPGQSCPSATDDLADSSWRMRLSSTRMV